jgi:hypothetical protein
MWIKALLFKLLIKVIAKKWNGTDLILEREYELSLDSAAAGRRRRWPLPLERVQEEAAANLHWRGPHLWTPLLHVSIIKTCAVCVVCICQRVREYEFASSCVGSLLARVCIGDLAAADLAESSTARLMVKMVRPKCSQEGEAHDRRWSELPGSVRMFRQEDRWSSWWSCVAMVYKSQRVFEVWVAEESSSGVKHGRRCVAG